MSRGRASKVGDTRTSPNGYHYTRTPDGWELTGRIIGAQIMGRKLTSDERIKYKDNNRLNNTPENIEVYTKKPSSAATQKAKLEAKMEDIRAQIEQLEAKLSESS